MTPKNLKFPLTWEERRPTLYKGVLIVPHYYDHHKDWKAPENLFPKPYYVKNWDDFGYSWFKNL